MKEHRLTYYKKSGDVWIVCAPDGVLEAPIYEEMNPDSLSEFLPQGLILDESPITFQLASSMATTTADAHTLTCSNRGCFFGEIGDAMPYEKFVTDRNLLLMLQIRVPIFMLHTFPDELRREDMCIVWTGFLVNSEYVQGNNLVRLEFADLTYHLGEFQMDKNYAHINRELFLEEIQEKIPFILDTEIDIRNLPDVWDMQVKHLDDGRRVSNDFMYDPVEICRKNDSTIYHRVGYHIGTMDINSGGGMAGDREEYATIVRIAPGRRILHDPAYHRTNSEFINPPPLHHVDGVIPPQDFDWDNSRVYYVVLSSSLFEIRDRRWNDTTMTYDSYTFAMSVSPEQMWDSSLNNLRLNVLVVGGLKYFVLSSLLSGRVAIWSDFGPSSLILLSNLGGVMQFVPGHKLEIGGSYIEYPFLIRRIKTSEWTWARINPDYVEDDEIFEIVDAHFSDDAKNIAENIPPGELRYIDLDDGMSNKLCFLEPGSDYNHIVIVDSRFNLIEKLYPGDKPPREGYEHYTKPNADWLLTLGLDFRPVTLALHPQYKGGAVFYHDGMTYSMPEIHTMYLTKGTPDYVARLDVENQSIGKALAKMGLTDNAYIQMMPNMVLVYRNPFNVEPGIDYLNEVQDGAGDEDAIKLWDEQYCAIETSYGSDNNLLMGNKLWNHKSKNLDLKEIIFSADYARMIALGYYLIFNPYRHFVSAPLYRGHLLLPWTSWQLHEGWIVTSCKLDLGNETTELQGITPPMGLFAVVEVMDSWFTNFHINVQCIWYYNGQDPENPEHPEYEPWLLGTTFIGDELGWSGEVCNLVRDLLDEIAHEISLETGCLPEGANERDVFRLWWQRNMLRWLDRIIDITGRIIIEP